MDVRFINPFIVAVGNVFEMMLRCPVRNGSPAIKTFDCNEDHVIAAIQIHGEVEGIVALCFPSTSAVNIATKLVGHYVRLNSDDLRDALGELVNVVAGDARNCLKDLTTSVDQPRIIKADDLNRAQNGQATLVLPFRSPAGSFHLEVTLTKGTGRMSIDALAAIATKHAPPDPFQEIIDNIDIDSIDLDAINF